MDIFEKYIKLELKLIDTELEHYKILKDSYKEKYQYDNSDYHYSQFKVNW